MDRGDHGRRRPVPKGLAALALLAVALVVGGGMLGGLLPSFGNPFGSERRDRSGPALLRSIEDISEYRAATGNFQVIVDLEDDTRFVPSVISGERTLFVAAGGIDAGVDFGALGPGAVRVDGDAVTITLPAPRLFEPTVDPERSYVVDRDRGVLDRIGSAFQDNPTSERDLYLLAEEKMRAAAAEAELLAQAERNTRLMLEALMRASGFTTVTVEFEEPDAS